MQDRCTFEFAIIRVVPKVEREEFFNVGAILFSKRKMFLGIKFKINEKRLAAFSDELDIEALNDYLKAWEMVCAGAPDGGVIGEMELASRFRWLTASRSSIIQSSETHPGLSADPERELEDLFNRYVL
jgi:hypothetical protein